MNKLADAAARTEPSGRKRLTAANLALLLFAVAAAACGQLLLKHGMSGAAERAKGGSSLAVAAATSPFVWFGLGVFGISAIAWMTTLSRVPLSIAYPFNSGCGTPQQISSYVEVWIYDTAGAQSDPVTLHLVCSGV